MFRASVLMGVSLLGLAFVVGVGTTQEKKDKVKGQLPPGWKKLDLSKDQIGKIYEVQGKFKAKIKDLQAQITELQTMERAEMVKVLTPDQKEMLSKLAIGEVKKDKDDKKKPPPDKDKDDKKKPSDKDKEKN